MEIRLIQISKRFSGRQVIFPLTLTIRSGSFTTLLGPSGCGKTTLLRMIAGLETPDEGEIWLDDRCVFSAASGVNLPPEKRALGFVFQDFALWPHMTVYENVAFGLRARRDTENLRERVMQALVADAFLLPGRSDVKCDNRSNLEDIPQLATDWNTMMGVASDTAAKLNALCQK